MPSRAADPSVPPAVGVILAGGASSRFGSPKGLARVGSARMIDRVARALREATPGLLLVANDPAAADWLPGVPRIADRLPGGGGLSGVHAALAHTRRHVVVVAWDMPFVTGPLLRALWQRCAAGGGDACYPESASPVGMEPFCACYAPSSMDAIEAALRAGDAGGARVAHALPRPLWMPAADVRAFGDPERLLFSVNSPADLARAEAMAAGAM